MSRKWSYNEQEFEVDLQDANFAEKYETAFALMGEEEKLILKAGSSSKIIRSYCDMYFHLFDAIYGPGTASRLFDDKVNARLCDEAYAVFMDAAVENARDAAQSRSDALSRYAPKQNRQQQRSKKS